MTAAAAFDVSPTNAAQPSSVGTSHGLAAGVKPFVSTECAGITSEGDPQPPWEQEFTATPGPWETYCSKDPKMSYTSAPSGQGLEEFGMPGKVLRPILSGNQTTLDGFVGTDDAPSPVLLEEGKEASGSPVLTVPIAAAPIALIFHVPTGCTFKLASWHLSKAIVEELWSRAGITWETLLAKLNATGVTGCNVAIKREVNSDRTGTAFALKWYLCQIEANQEAETVSEAKCPKWKSVEILTEAPEWRASTEPVFEHIKEGVKVQNKNTREEIGAVSEESGAVGYANFANVEAEGGFEPYKEKGTRFWAALEGEKNDFSEPKVSGKNEGDCPLTLNEGQKKALGKIEAAKPNWEGFHLSYIKTGELYPLCTLTYGVTWENFSTLTLTGEKGYSSEMHAKETANTVKSYLQWVTDEKAKYGLVIKGYQVPAKAVIEKAKLITEKIKP